MALLGLFINNGHEHSAVQVRRGGSFFQNQIGISFINSGESRTFHIDMPRIGTDIFGEHIDISNIVVGIGGIEVPLRTATGETNLRLLRDHAYTVNVSGDHTITQGQPGAMQAIINITGRRLTIDDFVN
ncbi:MAG: hypothetical protein FWE37_02385 [Spirochaetaceae bacterium]|nr:hypothetical protein [Spirochaetaceae bacterium]